MNIGRTLSDYQPEETPIRFLPQMKGGQEFPSVLTESNFGTNPINFGDTRVTKSEPVNTLDGGNRNFKFPPFFPFLSESLVEPVDPEAEDPPTELRVTFIQGYIYSYHGDVNGGDAMSELLVAGMPVDGTSVVVEAGDKLWVVADEDVEGRLSNPTFQSGPNWPVSVPAKLIGGSDQTGTPGFRIWRLSEIAVQTIEEEDIPYIKIHRTGIIEHVIDRRIENLENEISGDEGRVFDEFDDTSGEYKFRTLQGKRGQRIVEGEEEDSAYLKVMLPEGVDGAVLYYTGGSEEDPELGGWVKLDPPESSTTHVLAISGGNPYWLETEDCPSEPET
jgi:hypothetical protein